MKKFFYLKHVYFKIFKFFSWQFGHAGKQFDKKVEVNFKICDVRPWETNTYSTFFAQYMKK